MIIFGADGRASISIIFNNSISKWRERSTNITRHPGSNQKQSAIWHHLGKIVQVHLSDNDLVVTIKMMSQLATSQIALQNLPTLDSIVERRDQRGPIIEEEEYHNG